MFQCGWYTRDFYLSAVTSRWARFSRLASFNRMVRDAAPMTLDEKNQVPNGECVRSSTLSYAPNEPRDVIVSFRISRTMADRIESYRRQQVRRPTKTEA